MTDVKDPGKAVVKADPGTKGGVRPRRGGSALDRRRTGVPTEARPQDFGGGQVAWPATAQYAIALVERRRTRFRRLMGWFCLVVVLPTLMTAVYFLTVATPRYTSSFEFTYQTYRSPNSLASGLVQSVTGTSQQNTVDIGTIVYEYLRSTAIADKLDASLDLHRRFSDAGIDWLSRLSPDASREAFLRYFRSHVDVSQGLGGYIKVDVDTTDPAFSQTFAKAIVSAADQMIDDLTARARQNEVKFAEAELARQEDRVRKARTALTEFQNKHGDQDPSRAASQIGTIVGSIEGQLSDARTQLASMETSANQSSPIVAQLKTKISSLEQQLKAEQQRLATDKSGTTPYSQVLDEYSSLQLEQDFAKNAYLAAQQGLVVARADAAGKQNYLVDFIPPNLPQHANWMVTVEATATVLLVMLVVFAFGSLMAGAARDQAFG